MEIASTLSAAKSGASIVGLALKFRPRLWRLSAADRVAARAKWKPLFDEEIARNHRENLNQSAIVRDLRRLDIYPDTKATKGIGPWFRVALVGTYHRGFYLALGGGSVVHDEKLGGWRATNYEAGEKPPQRTLLLGAVPFEQVEHVDWDGDEYYNAPQIYCHFDRRGEPYEEVAHYAEFPHPLAKFPPHYMKVAERAEVRKLTKKAGLPDY